VSVAEKAISPETAEWIDGPRFVAWLREHGLTSPSRQLGGSLARRVRDWEHGSAANVHTADQALVKLGLVLSEVPDDFWIESPKRRGGQGQRIPERTQAEIVRRAIELQEPPSVVARALRVDHKTVRNYIRLAEAA